MAVRPLPLETLAAWLTGTTPPEWPADDIVVVDLDEGMTGGPSRLHPGLAAVVVGRADAPAAHLHAGLCDVVLDRGDTTALAAIEATVARSPLAAFAYVAVLRGAPRPLDDGLVLESATYSALQGGPELAAWLDARDRRVRAPDPEPPVTVDRDGDVLRITLQRPHVRNALNAAMREALLDALAVAAADPTVRVELRGAGPDFCAGGDLDEFGTFADPASAHRLRLDRSLARVVAALAPRTTAYVHGHCAGSGIELPAFAGRVVADPAVRISLPELALGLIPGAGGTVSLPARIGRHRTALLGLTGTPIDAETALAWGLVDELSP